MMNSNLANAALHAINPTINTQSGDIGRLPVPVKSSKSIDLIVNQALELSRADSNESETTYDFTAPANWSTGSMTIAERTTQLFSVEQRINDEMYDLYGVSAADRAAIEAELAEPSIESDSGMAALTEDGEDVSARTPLTEQELARRWLSYSVGIVVGRFKPGVNGELGRGAFSADIAKELCGLVVTDGVVVLDSGHADDLATRVERGLELMLGDEAAVQVVGALDGEAASGSPRRGTAGTTDLLRRYVEREFFRWHVKLYRSRPVYWLLQSSKRSYGLYLFHERATRDTLYLIQGNRYLGGKINHTRQRGEDLQRDVRTAQGARKRELERELEKTETLLAELEEFALALKAITDATNERGETVGWAPELDDGVILNLAPLYTVLPAWAAEPRKYWDRLATGEYDWSYTAMRYWPDRVATKCRTNKSYAIAHNRLDLYDG